MDIGLTTTWLLNWQPFVLRNHKVYFLMIHWATLKFFLVFHPFNDCTSSHCLALNPFFPLRRFLSRFITHLSLPLRQHVSLHLHLSFAFYLHVLSPPPCCILSSSLPGTRELARSRESLCDDTSLQSACITAKCNEEPCECHQYASRGYTVTL